MNNGEIESAMIGRLTADPVQRTSKNGKPWLALMVAVGSGDDSRLVSVALFGDGVTDLTGKLSKADRVYVEGRIELRQWTDREGRERAGLQVTAFAVQPLGQIGRRRPANSLSTKAAQNWQAPPGVTSPSPQRPDEPQML